MERVYRRVDGTMIRYPDRYTKEEIRQAWTNPDTLVTGLIDGIMLQVNESSALELTALYIRKMYPNPLGTRYRHGRLTVWFGYADEPRVARDHFQRILNAHDLCGADEGGRLFAEDGSFDVDLPALVQMLMEVAEKLEENPETKDLAVEIHRELALSYVGAK